MFDEVTRRERRKGGARRARFVLASTVVQALLVAGAVAATAALRAPPAEERLVPVTFVPPAPPPARAPEPAAGPAGTPMPAARAVRPRPPPRAEPEPAPPPPALVQPRELPEAAPTAPPAPPEPEHGAGSDDGVVGGAPGGGGGAPIPGTVGVLGAPGAIEDAPEDAARRNLLPRQADPGCVQRSQERELELREHREIEGRVLAVEFQVSPTGALGGFRSLDRSVDPRVKASMWSVIRRCRWIPGTDAEGRPATRTVSLNFRFTPE